MNEWVWSIGGMILTGETEVLGEKYYTASVVDEWMSMERLWNDTGRDKLKHWKGKSYGNVTLSTTNPTWPAPRLKPILRVEGTSKHRSNDATYYVIPPSLIGPLYEA
jgi:hypothetical protein